MNFMVKTEMNYKKYKSNGDLDKILNHSCICCKRLKNDTEIFVFTDNSVEPIQPSFTTSTTIFSGQNTAYRPAKQNTIFMCAECIYKLSKKISEETITKLVADEI